MQRYHWVQDYLIDHTQETLTVNLPLLLRQPAGSRRTEAMALCDSFHAFEVFCLMHLYVHLEQIPNFTWILRPRMRSRCFFPRRT